MYCVHNPARDAKTDEARSIAITKIRLRTRMTSKIFELAKKLSRRPYHVMAAKSETTDGQLIFNACALEFEGCIGQGNSPEEAITDLRKALVDYIESLLEDGLEVPDPLQL
jgi:predicted RNase H-like HicB family nuclease